MTFGTGGAIGKPTACNQTGMTRTAATTQSRTPYPTPTSADVPTESVSVRKRGVVAIAANTTPKIAAFTM
ncbi:hypothetical protein BG842_11575 [Haladaptatus sp. W1]|uniref:hypothetical protein n=1 Tax=Haladaptatus sp. W1 TaxID=1897478 RepID=UPI0008499A92|nr:hypothetical protein [Haladaptatus sp. W1]ODR79152.1 hypothetical protein BG842_11575 [Haladaptatus sp. W1]